MTDGELIKKWLFVFGEGVNQKVIEKHVTASHNFLWHLFTWGEVPCLEGYEAKKAFDELQYTEAIQFCGGYSNQIKDVSVIEKISARDVEKDPHGDVYIVAKDFSWTYVRTHESDLGPYLCIKSENLGYLKFKYAKR